MDYYIMDYYIILGVPSNASQQEIKAAYKRAALKFHPDRNHNSSWAEERFKQINTAYQILSDPYKRQSYDALRMYKQINHQNAPSAPPYGGYYRSRPYHYQPPGRKPYPEGGVNSAENRKATLWAFSFVFVVAVLVTAVFIVYQYQRKQERLTIENENEQMMGQARTYYEQGQIIPAMQVFNDLQERRYVSAEIEDYRDYILNDIKQKATSTFEEKDFARSGFFHKIYMDYGDYYSPEFQWNYAVAERETGNYIHAISLFSGIRGYVKEYAINEAIGHIYDQYLGDKVRAEDFYFSAVKAMDKEYKGKWGNAYSIILNPSDVPDDHAAIFIRLAELQRENGHIEAAIGTCKWLLHIRPLSISNYEMLASIYLSKQQSVSACNIWKRAIRYNLKEAIDDPDKFCP